LPGPDDAIRPAPTRPTTPSGPIVEDAKGEQAQNRTWQDLLTNPVDEAMFEHYATGRIAVIEAGGEARAIGTPGMFASLEPSPDGRFLLVERVQRPFSYQVPWFRFARAVEVWDLEGSVVATIDAQGPAETIPIEGVRTGPRDVQWIPTEAATLVWTEALDGGDPKQKAEHRDRVLVQTAPFVDAPVERWRATHRVMGFDPLERGARALVTEYDRDRRWSTTWLVDLASSTAAPKKLFDRSSRDAYADPGRPVHRVLSSGLAAVRVEDDAIWLAGEGATPAGDRPFLDRGAERTRGDGRFVARRHALRGSAARAAQGDEAALEVRARGRRGAVGHAVPAARDPEGPQAAAARVGVPARVQRQRHGRPGPGGAEPLRAILRHVAAAARHAGVGGARRRGDAGDRSPRDDERDAAAAARDGGVGCDRCCRRGGADRSRAVTRTARS
jgi:hypothetical protein